MHILSHGIIRRRRVAGVRCLYGRNKRSSFDKLLAAVSGFHPGKDTRCAVLQLPVLTGRVGRPAAGTLARAAGRSRPRTAAGERRQ